MNGKARPWTMDAYPYEAMRLARMRGWSDSEHQAALDKQDEDEVGLTHPILYLTEDEAERYFA